MIINRHNYEEFFLLYVDHELSAGERKAVETFIRENNDLEEELVMLQQSKLKPDHDVFFENKKSLLKQPSGKALVNEMNYEEFFVLYVDGELSEEEKTDVEKFIFQYPHLRLELDLLQQTSLKPDLDIVFEKKEVLYHREEEPVQTIMLPWLRFSAAAIILLLAGLLIFKNINNDVPRTLAIDNRQHPVLPVDVTKKNIMPPVTHPVADALQYERKGDQKNKVMKQQPVKKDLLPAIKVHTDPEAQMSDMTMEVPVKKAVTASLMADEKEVRTGVLANKVNPVSDQMLAITDHAAASPQEEDTDHFVKQASLNNMTNDPENGISILTASSGKTKMRGFFRKVSRVIEKTTGIDEDSNKSVLVGSFQIALK